MNTVAQSSAKQHHRHRYQSRLRAPLHCSPKSGERTALQEPSIYRQQQQSCAVCGPDPAEIAGWRVWYIKRTTHRAPFDSCRSGTDPCRVKPKLASFATRIDICVRVCVLFFKSLLVVVASHSNRRLPGRLTAVICCVSAPTLCSLI